MRSKKYNYKNLYFFIFFILITFVLIYYFSIKKIEKPIKVGIIHSLSGETSSVEQSILQATLLAIEEINKAGGILNKSIEPIILDAKSNKEIFASNARGLLKDKQVDVIFGGFTVDSRKALKDVVEKYNSLLFFPGLNEGLEESNNIIYLGMTLNQFLIPTLSWAVNNLGNKFFLLHSNNYFSKIVNTVLKDILPLMGGQIVGEAILNNQNNFETIIPQIDKSGAQIIINLLSIKNSLLFFKEIEFLKKQKKLNIIAIGLAPNDLSFELDLNNIYLIGSYFEKIDTPQSNEFKEKIKNKFGIDKMANDYSQAAYNGVNLWAQAVKKAHSFNPEKLKNVLKNSTLNTPEGLIIVDSNNYSYKIPKLLKINQKNFELIPLSKNLLKPIIYPNEFFIESFNPIKKSKNSWREITEKLYFIDNAKKQHTGANGSF